MKAIIEKKKIKDKDLVYRGFYIRKDQDRYLLNKSIVDYEASNKKSKILRIIIDNEIGGDDNDN